MTRSLNLTLSVNRRPAWYVRWALPDGKECISQNLGSRARAEEYLADLTRDRTLSAEIVEEVGEEE